MRRWAAVAVAAATAATLAGCGRAVSPGSTLQQTASVPSLATSVISQDGTSWAVLQMGGAASKEEDFWQLFARPRGATDWQLATPAGVADNGGLVISQTGPLSALTGFRPSQDLKFSPLAATANGGRAWSATGPLQPGLASLADGLAAGPASKLIALTASGAATSGDGGSTWTPLISRPALSADAATRPCRLTKITATAFGIGGSPMLAGACSRPGVAGLFEQSAGGWRPAGLSVPASLRGSAVVVLALATSGTTTTAVLAAGAGRHASLFAAWLTGGKWTLSPAFPRRGQVPTSIAVWPGGAAGLVLPGRTGALLNPPSQASPDGSWRSLALPPSTGTLALNRSGQPEALAASRNLLTVWQLDAVAGQAVRWQRAQTVKVTIPYGSSG
jgi:hypothetical protein